MKKDELTVIDLLLEAIIAVSAAIYIGLQIYYGVIYGVNAFNIVMNVAALLLVYTGLTLMQIYPEKVNGLTKAVCIGSIRKYTIHMVRLVKLIFVISLLFTSICDVMGQQINKGYSLLVVVLIVVTALYYEYQIIKILRENKKK